eukprot:scaffold22589_cov138-Cylindrotheca_fusiformis.AAC.20
MNRGRQYAMTSFLIGIIGMSLTIYVFSSCNFYEASWIEDDAQMFNATPGIYVCKYADGSEPFAGPKNFIDGLAVIALVIALVSGIIATVAIGTFAFHLKLRIKNPGVSSCLFMMAAIAQVPTYVVLISAACDMRYDGECKIVDTGFVNVGAIIVWIIASCFSRSVVGAGQSSGGGGDGG